MTKGQKLELMRNAPVDVALALSTGNVDQLAPAAKREASYYLLLLGTPLGYGNGAKLGHDY